MTLTLTSAQVLETSIITVLAGTSLKQVENIFNFVNSCFKDKNHGNKYTMDAGLNLETCTNFE